MVTKIRAYSQADISHKQSRKYDRGKGCCGSMMGGDNILLSCAVGVRICVIIKNDKCLLKMVH